jgi:hypothetical protein
VNLDIAVVRSPRERGVPRDLLIRDSRPAHRPRDRFAIRIRTVEDVARLRASGLPVFPLEDDHLEMLGYPMRFPPIVVAARVLEPAVRSDLKVLSFRSEEAALRPRIEDLVVAMLKFDPIAARAVFERNRALFDTAYLTKRIYQEDLERVATTARFHDVLDLPAEGEAPPRAGIERLVRSNWPKGILP